MKRAITLAKINHPWNRYNMRMLRSWPIKIPNMNYAHIIPFSRMVDFCESHSPYHVCLTICPFAHLVYATSHLFFVTFNSYLVSWLAMILACTYYTDFTDGWFLRELYPFSCSLTSCCSVIPPLALHKLMCSKVLDYSGT
jgi:hypothetical protein